MKSLRRTNRLEKETFRLFWQVNTVQKQKRAINWFSFREISRPLTVKSGLFPQYEDQLDYFDWFVSQPVVKKETRLPEFSCSQNCCCSSHFLLLVHGSSLRLGVKFAFRLTLNRCCPYPLQTEMHFNGPS